MKPKTKKILMSLFLAIGLLGEAKAFPDKDTDSKYTILAELGKFEDINGLKVKCEKEFIENCKDLIKEELRKSIKGEVANSQNKEQLQRNMYQLYYATKSFLDSLHRLGLEPNTQEENWHELGWIEALNEEFDLGTGAKERLIDHIVNENSNKAGQWFLETLDVLRSLGLNTDERRVMNTVEDDQQEVVLPAVGDLLANIIDGREDAETIVAEVVDVFNQYDTGEKLVLIEEANNNSEQDFNRNESEVSVNEDVVQVVTDADFVAIDEGLKKHLEEKNIKSFVRTAKLARAAHNGKGQNRKVFSMVRSFNEGAYGDTVNIMFLNTVLKDMEELVVKFFNQVKPQDADLTIQMSNEFRDKLFYTLHKIFRNTDEDLIESLYTQEAIEKIKNGDFDKVIKEIWGDNLWKIARSTISSYSNLGMARDYILSDVNEFLLLDGLNQDKLENSESSNLFKVVQTVNAISRPLEENIDSRDNLIKEFSNEAISGHLGFNKGMDLIFLKPGKFDLAGYIVAAYQKEPFLVRNILSRANAEMFHRTSERNTALHAIFPGVSDGVGKNHERRKSKEGNKRNIVMPNRLGAGPRLAHEAAKDIVADFKQFISSEELIRKDKLETYVSGNAKPLDQLRRDEKSKRTVDMNRALRSANIDGYTPLNLAAAAGYYEVFEELVSTLGSELFVPEEHRLGSQNVFELMVEGITSYKLLLEEKLINLKDSLNDIDRDQISERSQIKSVIKRIEEHLKKLKSKKRTYENEARNHALSDRCKYIPLRSSHKDLYGVMEESIISNLIARDVDGAATEIDESHIIRSFEAIARIIRGRRFNKEKIEIKPKGIFFSKLFKNNTWKIKELKSEEQFKWFDGALNRVIDKNVERIRKVNGVDDSNFKEEELRKQLDPVRMSQTIIDGARELNIEEGNAMALFPEDKDAVAELQRRIEERLKTTIEEDSNENGFNRFNLRTLDSSYLSYDNFRKAAERRAQDEADNVQIIQRQREEQRRAELIRNAANNSNEAENGNETNANQNQTIEVQGDGRFKGIDD